MRAFYSRIDGSRTSGTGFPAVGILTEYDALPGLGNEAVPTKMPRKDGNTDGHGCGHNLICAGAIGAVIALKNHMEKEKVPGTGDNKMKEKITGGKCAGQFNYESERVGINTTRD